MDADRYPLHHSSEAELAVDAPSLFSHLDDHRRLAGHMKKRSLMMAGASMRVETDALEGQLVGSAIRISGRVLGVNLLVEEVVTERVPPLRKTWETRGEPRLLVIGPYRMGFTISPQGKRSRLVVFIDYQLAPRGFIRGLSQLFGRFYAAWCTRRMVTDAQAATAATKSIKEAR